MWKSFSRMSLWEVDRFTSNHSHNVHRPILHISSKIHFTSRNASFCLSVCLSVTYLEYLSLTDYWNAVERSYFMQIGSYYYTSERWSNHKMKRAKIKVTRNENAKERLCAYFRENWTNLYQAKLPKMIFGQFVTYCQINTFHQRQRIKFRFRFWKSFFL